MSVSLLSKAVDAVMADVIGKGPLERMDSAKKARILKVLLKLNKAGTIADQGLDLIEFAGAFGKGDRVKMKVLLKGKLTEELKNKFDAEKGTKAGEFYAVIDASREQSVDLVKFMSAQGDANGNLITSTCAK
jgi:type I restriction-modification system DNA methylase subunit